ncbi:hypothetical protein EV137_5353 [Kribbella pratensis]|uniref:Uncharacterized protein n=1 Tax=Kribbella pratensis TaxID=2512112 RepID=A0ABY2FA32_9ACTN|nr:hypothetical protein [Kribbella pratensis]TDW87280.1 hypothetical protein EV137_5353 [Kribbella pratensis]
MNTSSLTDDPVSPDPEDVITAEVSRRFPPALLDDLWSQPHRLSTAALVERISYLEGHSFRSIRASLQSIVDEVELYRIGRDDGYEDGHRAGYNLAVRDMIHNPDTISTALLALRDKETGQ